MMISEEFRWGKYRELSAKERDVFDFMLRESLDNRYSGLTHEETAHALEMHPGSVKNAIRKLKDWDAIIVVGEKSILINPECGIGKQSGFIAHGSLKLWFSSQLRAHR